MITPMSGVRIDGLQYSVWDRDRFLEWRAGGLDAVHVTISIWESSRATLRIIGEWARHVKDNPDLIVLADTVTDIYEAKRTGKTAVILGLQNVTSFEDDLDLVWGFYQAGVRIAQLTYNTQNSAGAGCWEENDPGVSSHFGKNLIREMNQVGMVIDVSHCGEKTCRTALELSESPVAITHGNPGEFVGPDVELSIRNRSTGLIRDIAANGGIIGLSMYPRLAPGGNSCTLELFSEMVEWTAERIGIDHISIGTDLYLGHEPDVLKWWRTGRWAREPAIKISGLPEFPEWMKTPAQFPIIGEGLARRGFSEEDCNKVLGDNFLRYLERVQTSRSSVMA